MDTVSAQDVLQEQQDLELEAAELLPYKTDTCSFSLGYLNQQVYTCMTCTPPGSTDPVGLCFACSVSCHSEHNIAEIYVKRHFRCDCGIKDPVPNCQLKRNDHHQETNNSENVYNHNFYHRYCLCDTEYDEEGTDGVMVQCLACQDWFHQHCILNNSVHKPIPLDDQYMDLICANCVDKLSLYPLKEISVLSPDTCSTQPHDTLPCICLSKARQPDSLPKHDGDHAWLFLPEGWRAKLCRCENCQRLVEKNKVTYLFHEEDVWTPELDPDAHVPEYDRGMRMLEQVNRVHAIEGIMAMNQLSTNLIPYLRQFAEQGKVVTESDIKLFFESFKSKKC